MATKEEAIKALETLKEWCKGNHCSDCVFNDATRSCIFCEGHTPGLWKVPNPRRWSDAEIAMAKALKMYGYTTVECCRDGQFLSKNGKGLWLYLPPNFEFGVTRPGDSVSLDNIIREAEQK